LQDLGDAALSFVVAGVGDGHRDPDGDVSGCPA
jgi:hypothetical protein